MIRVAIVEDEKDFRLGLKALINGTQGFSCSCDFDNAEDAIEKFSEFEINVAIIDIHLPLKNGIELIQTLKPKFPEIEFIILTSFDDTENILKALKAGATGYITKDVQPAKLLESITEIHHGGSPMSANIARKIIETFSVKKENPKNSYQNLLTETESKVLDLLSQGYKYKQIAEKLFVSIETIRTHARNIYRKLEVNSKIEAINKIYGNNKI